MSPFVRVAVTLLAAAVATSCTVGPDYKRPPVELPVTHRGAGQTSGASLADVKWFELFNDDRLTQVVETALKQNFELRIAAERVLQARAAYGITRADQFPAVDVSGGVTALRNSQVGATRGIPPGVDTSVSYTQFGFSLGWELDVCAGCAG